MAGGTKPMNEKQVEHLNHPFYKKAERYRETVRQGQILKGAEKYPKPFSPDDWTAKELLLHAMQENVDQAHYIVGLATKLEQYEQALLFYAKRDNYKDKYVEPSEIWKDEGGIAREALRLGE